jgi:hypothetical protein
LCQKKVSIWLEPDPSMVEVEPPVEKRNAMEVCP